VNASPPKIVKGNIDSPSLHDRFAPKKRVVIITMSVGISVPVMPCRQTA
jgi:hypothetical protein